MRDNGINGNRKEGESLKEHIIGDIKGRILSGELKIGDRLESERVLAERYSISRGSASQAVLELERMGFLKIVPRQGTFVSDYRKTATPETLASIMSIDPDFMDSAMFSDFLELCLVLERECVRLACHNLNGERKAVIEKAGMKVAEATTRTEAIESLYSYHQAISVISGNAAYHMIFYSFSKMINRFLEEHYADENEFERTRELISSLTASIRMRDVYEALNCHYTIYRSAADYIRKLHQEKTGTGK